MDGVFRNIYLLIAFVGLVACQQEDLLSIPLGTPAVQVPTPGVDAQETATAPAVESIGNSNSNAVSPSPTATDLATPSQTPEPSTTPKPTATPTRGTQPSATPEPTSTVAIRATPTKQPAPTKTVQEPAIHHFELVSTEELNPGKRVTFSWSGEGNSATILADTRQRFLPWWEVPISGTLTVDLNQTLISNPVVTLTVAYIDDPLSANDVFAKESLVIPWECPHDYFFSPAPEQCARDVPVELLIAEQAFEGGRMVWLSSERKILVLYNQMRAFSSVPEWVGYDDTWVEGEPISDPDIEPPEGFYQPVRGFGKVWRENAQVRERLGWALEPEGSHSTQWQYMDTQVIGSTSFLRLADGRVIQLRAYEWGQGTWWYHEGDESGTSDS